MRPEETPNREQDRAAAPERVRMVAQRPGEAGAPGRLCEHRQGQKILPHPLLPKRKRCSSRPSSRVFFRSHWSPEPALGSLVFRFWGVGSGPAPVVPSVGRCHLAPMPRPRGHRPSSLSVWGVCPVALSVHTAGSQPPGSHRAAVSTPGDTARFDAGARQAQRRVAPPGRPKGAEHLGRERFGDVKSLD